MKKTNIQWSILLALALVSVSVVWVLAADISAIPLFESPPPPPTPGWEQLQITPTPRPQPVILPNVTAGPPSQTAGLRGYWNLNEANTGNRADSSPTGGNTLTNVGGVSWTTNGKVGNASDFENSGASTQYLKIESYQAVGLNFNHSFTLVGWIKRESTGSNMVLASKYTYGTGINQRAYRLQLTENNNLRLVVSPNGMYNTAYVVTGGSILASTTSWYHVAAVFDADSKRLKLYKNGALDADRTVTYNTVFNADAPFMLAANLKDGAAELRFDGLMDEWRAYNRVLSPSEIQTLANE